MWLHVYFIRIYLQLLFPEVDSTGNIDREIRVVVQVEYAGFENVKHHSALGVEE